MFYNAKKGMAFNMKSVLIIGLGRFGRHMAQKLLDDGHSVMIVERDEARADMAVDLATNIQIADATNEMFLRSIGVSDFDLCVIAIGDNFQSSLEITVLLKDLGAKFILARASRDVHRKLLLRNGADRVVYAEREMAERLAVSYGSDSIFDYIGLSGNIGIYEIAVPEQWLGHSIVEMSVRARYHVSILATKRNGVICPLPHPDHVFDSAETLMVMGDYDDIKKLTK